MRGKEKEATVETASVSDSTAQTLVPSRAPEPATSRGNAQPTGFDVSPEAIRRAEQRRASEAPVDTSYMTEEEKERLRKKGINPELKAEMDAKVYGKVNGKGSFFKSSWRKFLMGGGW